VCASRRRTNSRNAVASSVTKTPAAKKALTPGIAGPALAGDGQQQHRRGRRGDDDRNGRPVGGRG